MPEMKDQKTEEGIGGFIVAFVLAFAVACFCGFLGIAFSIYATPFERVCIVSGASIVVITLGGVAAILFSRKGRKKTAIGIVAGALAPLLVFGGCLVAFGVR